MGRERGMDLSILETRFGIIYIIREEKKTHLCWSRIFQTLKYWFTEFDRNYVRLFPTYCHNLSVYLYQGFAPLKWYKTERELFLPYVLSHLLSQCRKVLKSIIQMLSSWPISIFHFYRVYPSYHFSWNTSLPGIRCVLHNTLAQKENS